MSSPVPEKGRRSAAVPFLVLALLGLIALSGPARAQQTDPPPFPFPEPDFDLDLDPAEIEAFEALERVLLNGEGWFMEQTLEQDVLDNLFLEIALLIQLDAFGVTPSFMADIHEGYGPWPDTTRDALYTLLLEVDDNLAVLKNEVNLQVGPAPGIAFALDEIPADQRTRLASGQRQVLNAGDYARALNELLSFGNAEALLEIDQRDAAVIAYLPGFIDLLARPARITALRVSFTETAPTSDNTESIVGDPVQPASESAAFPWPIVIAVAAGLVLLLGIVLLMRRRRQTRAAEEGPLTEEIFDAHRRLAAALDESQIAKIAESTAMAITDATDAFIFRRADDGLRPVGDTTVAVGSALSRVMDTGQPIITTLIDDSAVSTAAICAVPLVSDGMVGAVLVVRRPSERPFDTEDRRRLEMLAPALGSALSSADTLGNFEHLALVDGLTSLGNRRRLDGDLETTLADAVQTDLPVAFAMIDVDHFKKFNDTHGHEAGDLALQTVARVIAETVRASDVVYRYGGEEFSVLLPGATLEDATLAAERMRAAVEAARIDGEETQPGGRLTISVGISTLESGDASGIKTRADEALYEAKAQGRNRAVIA